MRNERCKKSKAKKWEKERRLPQVVKIVCPPPPTRTRIE
jgi:hypothetical protein